MKNLVIILFIFLPISLLSQNVEIIQQADIKNLPEAKIFAFIEPTTDTSDIRYLATMSATAKNKKSVIENLYFDIRKEATQIGANCYKIRSFERGGSQNEAILILDCYVASESTLKENTKNHEDNVVFIFGGEREGEPSTSFKINDEEIELNSGTYYKITLKPEEKIKISKGSITGASITLRWEKDKKPAFYTLSGFGLAPMNQQPMNGISFNTANINKIQNISLGLLLTKLLKQANER